MNVERVSGCWWAEYPGSVESANKGLIERISQGWDDSPTWRARQILEQPKIFRRKRDRSRQPALRCRQVRCPTIQVHMLLAQLEISPRCMAVSIASWTMGRVHGLSCEASAYVP